MARRRMKMRSPKTSPSALTRIPAMSRLLPLMPLRNVTESRRGSFRLASPVASCAMRGAQSAARKRRTRATARMRTFAAMRSTQSASGIEIIENPPCDDPGYVNPGYVNRSHSIREIRAGIQLWNTPRNLSRWAADASFTGSNELDELQRLGGGNLELDRGQGVRKLQIAVV